PSQADGQRAPVREQPSTHDEVARSVELEEEQLARLKRLERDSPARLPEADLVDVGSARQKAEPVEVGDADEETHRRTASHLGPSTYASIGDPDPALALGEIEVGWWDSTSLQEVLCGKNAHRRVESVRALLQ